MIYAEQLWTHGTRADLLERELAIHFSEDPEGTRGLAYQNVVDGGRELARARIESCLSQSDDAWVKGLCGNSHPLESSAVSQRIEEFMRFKEFVRTQLGDEYLVGNIAVHNMSLGPNHECHGPVVNFRIYRHPSKSGPLNYDLDACMDLRSGTIILGLTKNKTGDHFYIPITATRENFNAVLEKLEELASVQANIDDLRQTASDKIGNSVSWDFWRVGDELAREFDLATCASQK
ncbi:MAG: hypothetical protein WCT46_01665 [Candidatus Gracilibacteria bacterium]|jgi:hypothetical protein